MNSLFPCVCCDSLLASKKFYMSLFDFIPAFEIDWYIQFQSPTDKNLQLAFVKRDHPSVPQSFQQSPQGVIISLETDHVDPLYHKACDLKYKIELSLRDEVWGQRHFMTKDPNGLLVDVIQMIEPSAEFLKAHGL